MNQAKTHRMKLNRVILIAMVLVMGVLGMEGMAAAQGIGVGVKGGVVFPDFSSDVFDIKNRTGWQAGLFIGGNRDGVVGVQGEFNFLQKRALSEHEFLTDTEVTVNYFQIPVLLRIHSPSQSAAGFQVYGIVGPSFDVKINETVEGALEIDDGFEGFDVGIIFGGGIEVGRFILANSSTRKVSLSTRVIRVVPRARTAAGALLVGGLLVGCGGESAAPLPTAEMTESALARSSDAASAVTPENPLAGTVWRLAEIQSMDDAVGTVIPDDPSLYTMQLETGGTVAMRLNCNRATGTWLAGPADDGASGGFELGPLAVTRALCPPPSLDEQIAARAEFIRSYLLRDGRLYLSLMADGGIWVWEPHIQEPSTGDSDANLESGDTQPARSQRISFEADESPATVTGSITGREMVDYTLRARAGQIMSVDMQTSHPSNYVNVLPPGSEAALFIGSTSGGEWTGTLPIDGDYVVRVYLMRSAARRNETARYTLTVGVTGRGDALVTGTPYHATGMVPCSIGPDPKGSAQCSFGVIRGAPGEAEVHLASPGFDVTVHEDDLRILHFAAGMVTSAEPTETVTAEKRGDEWSIGVNDFYFYVVPEAVIVGG